LWGDRARRRGLHRVVAVARVLRRVRLLWVLVRRSFTRSARIGRIPPGLRGGAAGHYDASPRHAPLHTTPNAHAHSFDSCARRRIVQISGSVDSSNHAARHRSQTGHITGVTSDAEPFGRVESVRPSTDLEVECCLGRTDPQRGETTTRAYIIPD